MELTIRREGETSAVTLVRPGLPSIPVVVLARGPVHTALLEGEWAAAGGGSTEGGGQVAVVSTVGERLAVFEIQGLPTALLAHPSGLLAIGTSDGLVLVVHPDRPEEAPRELARFGRTVLKLELDGGGLRAIGDDRTPRPLAEGEQPTAEERLVEGVLGRYAYPRGSVTRAVTIPKAVLADSR